MKEKVPARNIKAGESRDSPAWSLRMAVILWFHVSRSHIESEHEPVGSLMLERFWPGLIGLDVIRHHHKTIVSRRPPIFQVVDDNWIAGISREAVQLYFRSFPAIDRGVRFIL